MLVLHVPNALQNTPTDGIAQILSCSLWVNVPKIHRPIQTLGASHTLHSVGREWREGGKWRACVSTRWYWREARCLRNQGLSRCGLRGLCSCLLGFRNVRTAVLTVIDALASPCRFRGQSVDNLRPILAHSDLYQLQHTHLCRDGDAQKVDKPNVLIPDDLDLIDKSKTTEIVPQLLLG